MKILTVTFYTDFIFWNVYINFFGSEVSGDGDSFVHKLEFEAYIIPSTSTEYLSYWQQNEFNIDINSAFQL